MFAAVAAVPVAAAGAAEETAATVEAAAESAVTAEAVAARAVTAESIAAVEPSSIVVAVFAVESEPAAAAQAFVAMTVLVMDVVALASIGSDVIVAE